MIIDESKVDHTLSDFTVNSRSICKSLENE